MFRRIELIHPADVDIDGVAYPALKGGLMTGGLSGWRKRGSTSSSGPTALSNPRGGVLDAADMHHHTFAARILALAIEPHPPGRDEARRHRLLAPPGG
jgi:hypothetical protein